jgi:hypothetical protein
MRRSRSCAQTLSDERREGSSWHKSSNHSLQSATGCSASILFLQAHFFLWIDRPYRLAIRENRGGSNDAGTKTSQNGECQKTRKSLRNKEAQAAWETYAQNNQLLKLLVNLAAAIAGFGRRSTGRLLLVGAWRVHGDKASSVMTSVADAFGRQCHAALGGPRVPLPSPSVCHQDPELR